MSTITVNNYTVTIGENIHFDGTEEYKDSPIFEGIYKFRWLSEDSYRYQQSSSINKWTSQRYALTFSGPGGGLQVITADDAQSYVGCGDFNMVYTINSGSYEPQGPLQTRGTFPVEIVSIMDSRFVVDASMVSSNIPIFVNVQDAINYCFFGTMEYASLAVNFKEAEIVTDDTNEYYIYNRYRSAEISKGIVEFNGDMHQLNERILYNGNDICLYRDSTNPFMLTIKCGSGLVGSYFSNTGTIENVPYYDFSSRLDYSTPFYSTYSSRFGISDYEGNIAIGLATNLPIWDSESDADDFLNGTKDITECGNWDSISSDPVYKDIITNLTELPETATEFGEVYIRNIFSQLYLCNSSALYEISNNLFDYDVTTLSGVWEDIKKGLEMYGSDPMQCVQGLRFYPFDLTSIFADISSQNYVYFGAYQLQLQNSSVYKMVYANGYKDLGSVTIKRTFKDWRDFEPYTKLSIYLPYVGKYQLDLKKYYDKTVNIRYYLDIRTGACCACLIANGVLLDWFDGLIGTEMPITLTDYSSYAQNQINIIMRNAGIGVAGEGAVGALGVKGVKVETRLSLLHSLHLQQLVKLVLLESLVVWD